MEKATQTCYQNVATGSLVSQTAGDVEELWVEKTLIRKLLGVETEGCHMKKGKGGCTTVYLLQILCKMPSLFPSAPGTILPLL